MSLFISDAIDYKTSAAVLPRIARADKSAVEECIDVYGNMIWALAKQFTHSAADAEKAVPEIFNDIWKNAEFCDLEISDESIWIALIARRRLSEYALNDIKPQSPKKFTGEILADKDDKIKEQFSLLQKTKMLQ